MTFKGLNDALSRRVEWAARARQALASEREAKGRSGTSPPPLRASGFPTGRRGQPERSSENRRIRQEIRDNSMEYDDVRTHSRRPPPISDHNL
jgi:hypothetical protein